jgi:formamidopyrimidine-DNA glycosylase
LRFGICFADGGSLWMRDPRRLGAVELDPDESRFGPDATVLDRRGLDRAIGRSRAPLKAVLMDQSRIAGLGNLLTDELLWRAGLDPARAAGGLEPSERVALLRAIRQTVRVLGRRGGSHTGDLQASRVPGGVCPRDGAELLRRTVGGRTTYSCPVHQR